MLVHIANRGRIASWRHQMEKKSALLSIHRSPVDFPHKGGALIFSLIWPLTNGWSNHRDAGDLRRNRADYDVAVMGRAVDAVCTPSMRSENSLHVQSISLTPVAI